VARLILTWPVDRPRGLRAGEFAHHVYESREG